MKSKLARQIGVQRRSIRGHFYSAKNQRSLVFESTLERDHFYILEFDKAVRSFVEQPLVVESVFNGLKVKYYPDCLVYSVSEIPKLVEIKYTYDLEDPEKKEKLANKFRVLDEYSKENGYEFCVRTEDDIRSERLNNYKFIYRYFDRPSNYDKYYGLILDLCQHDKKVTVNSILDSVCSSKEQRAYVLPVIWHLVAIESLKCDIDIKLTNSTVVEVYA